MPTQELSDYVNGLSAATLSGTEELYLATNEKVTVNALKDFTLGSSQIWEALIVQTSTNAPVLTVIENSLGVTAVPAYSSVGSYSISGFATLLTGNIKIEALCTNGQIQASIATSSILAIATLDAVGVNQNDILFLGSHIRITKY